MVIIPLLLQSYNFNNLFSHLYLSLKSNQTSHNYSINKDYDQLSLMIDIYFIYYPYLYLFIYLVI